MEKLYKLNINDSVYIHITTDGWLHLINTVGGGYIKSCIEPYKRWIDGKQYFKLQMHSVFELLPMTQATPVYYETTILVDKSTLREIE